MTKIVIIGTGSGFGGRLPVDIMSRESLQDATICLCDLHPGRLKQVTGYVERTVERYDLPTKVVASLDRRELLPGADFVITSVSVGGGAYYGHPYKAEVVPLHGIREMFEELWEAEGDLLAWFDPHRKGPLPETCAA